MSMNSNKAVREVLGKGAINELLLKLNYNRKNPTWKLVAYENTNKSGCCLESSLKFRNFSRTWDFLNSVAGVAHKAHHHPTIVTTYNQVSITTTTHDADNQVTMLDILLAEAINHEFDLLKEKQT
ncbi:Piso0_000883 [Millerozyma farinosa CBS 7064]|uniref:4a-hydroxytetrahydrobiopterin dehydratase n=1 Tax=Pichia sorbitophila (strain ATCC MYA-4447 / BCRC 22081 / CBS 7064 / NBRC 10061 / NRRL Y-12695) TaxID=559304 RepID=G8YRS8_PICSO|nr:Piso0_000883 [Millerozyma farinosa CBS 7064]